MTDEPAILCKPPTRIGRRVGVQDALNDHRQDRHVSGTDGVLEGEIDSGVFQRGQRPIQHGLCERADEFPAA